MKTKEKWKLATIIVTIICIVLTPVFIYTEFQRRRYFAFGGEWLLLIFPMLTPLIRDVIEDIKKSF